MSWSQHQQAEDLHDQMTILIGSAIRLLRGESGVFVISNEAFDPQSSNEYTPYRVSENTIPLLITAAQQGVQPNSLHPLVAIRLPLEIVRRITGDEEEERESECGSLLLYDQAGPVGVLHFLRPLERGSRVEEEEADVIREADITLHLFIAQLATSLRFALRTRSLIKEQARFAAVFQYSTEGILTVDNALRIIDFNPAMVHLTGWRESEVLGQFYFKVLRPKDRQGNELGLQDSPILQTFAGQMVINREMQICTRDGQLVTVAVTASCVRSARGEPVNGILNVRDISRERQQEEQRTTFISVISHELQTPIAIIKGYAATLARTDAQLDSKVLRPRLQAIEEEADRLNKLVGNLLYASRIQAGGLLMDISVLDLGPLIDKVVRRLLARSPDVEVARDIPEELPPVMADPERIGEVLQNLLENAVKYSPEHQHILIRCYPTGDEVVTSISDAGMGISLREQEQIFDRFHRVGDPLAQATPGAGLGLYICRAIVEAHGGHIWVDSTLRQGSTFSFSLPREEKAQLPMVMF